MTDQQFTTAAVIFTLAIIAGFLRGFFIYRPIVQAPKLYLELHAKETEPQTAQRDDIATRRLVEMFQKDQKGESK
jgi:hypothetical protein